MQKTRVHLKLLLLAPAAAMLLGCGDGAQLEEQQKEIAQQKAKIEEQQQMIKQQGTKTAELQDIIVGLNAQLAALSQEKANLQTQVEQAFKDGAGNQEKTIKMLKSQNQQLLQRYSRLLAASRKSMKELGDLLRQ